MASQQICLKWNSFHSNIVTSFEHLWEEEGLVDVTLASEGQCIRAHKIILSACSPFFRRIFETNPCQHPVIILQDVHFPELEALLCFVYKGEVNIEQDDLPALLKAAESLQIRGLCNAGNSQTKARASSHSSADSNGSPPAKRQRSCSNSLPPPPLPALPPLHRAKTKRQAEAMLAEERSTSPPPATLAKSEPCSDPACEDSESLASLPLEESMDEGAPEDLQTLQPSRSSGPKHGEKLSLADINQLKGEEDGQEELEQKLFSHCQNSPADEDGPNFERLPFACLLPRREVLATWAQARTLEQLGCDLMKLLFSTEERLLCNVNGKMGKRQFNVHKVQLIREVLNHFSGMTPEDFDEQWKSCVTKIDTANRGLKRNLVLKGRKTTFLI